MSALWLCVAPWLGVAAGLVAGSPKRAAWLLFGTATLGMFLSVGLVGNAPTPEELLWDSYARVDDAARLFLAVINVVYWGVSIYVLTRTREGGPGQPIHAFAVLSSLFVLCCMAAVVSNHLMLTWTFLEATTLLGTLLIRLRDQASARKAAWTYLLFSSVGLALVLLGLACLNRGMVLNGQLPTLLVDGLVRQRALGQDVWTRLGLLLILFGYGTKMGLAPLYTWLPETYDHASPAVTALLAAVQSNCVVMAVFRVLEAFGGNAMDLVRPVFFIMGLCTMGLATVRILESTNYKKFIAYAAMNHAGVVAMGLAVGRTGAYGVVLYVVSNALLKAMLFLTCGLIKSHYLTKDMRRLRNLINEMPFSGIFFCLGTFGLLGFAPFGSFLGELMILSSLMDGQHYFVFGAMCFLLTVVFIATGRALFPVIWGQHSHAAPHKRESFLSALPNVVYVVILLSLGVFLPETVNHIFLQLAGQIGGAL